jgi:hypothetical protein
MDQVFTQGRVYSEIENPPGYVKVFSDSVMMIDDMGHIEEVIPRYVSKYFQELPELSEDDHEEQEQRIFADSVGEFSNGFPKGCAIASAVLLTLGIGIYLIIAWNS